MPGPKKRQKRKRKRARDAAEAVAQSIGPQLGVTDAAGLEQLAHEIRGEARRGKKTAEQVGAEALAMLPPVVASGTFETIPVSTIVMGLGVVIIAAIWATTGRRK